MQPTIYLFFNGNCLEAMTFYAETLGGEIISVTRNADAPNPESRMPGNDELVMNMAVRLGDTTLMASDSPPEWYSKPQGFRAVLSPDSMAETERVFAALSNGAEEIQMPLGETFWAERFAILTDKYGTPWMINFTGAKA